MQRFPVPVPAAICVEDHHDDHAYWAWGIRIGNPKSDENDIGCWA